MTARIGLGTCSVKEKLPFTWPGGTIHWETTQRGPTQGRIVLEAIVLESIWSSEMSKIMEPEVSSYSFLTSVIGICPAHQPLGDGFTDDTAAINRAISSGGRCAPGLCQSSTTSPAIVYFPSGTYRVSSPIIDYYFTQIIGNPNNLPIIKATSNFSATAVIDGNPYLPGNAEHPGVSRTVSLLFLY